MQFTTASDFCTLCMIALSVTSSVSVCGASLCFCIELEQEVGQVLVGQVVDRDVDGDAEHDALIAPRRAAGDGLAQHPARQVRDAAGLLDRRR